MKPFDFYFPTKVSMGQGRVNEVGKQCANYGKKAFVVYDPFLKHSELAKSIKKELAENGVGCLEYYDVVPNPRNTSIDEGIQICLKEQCDVVVAVGGGSAIDTAKAVALVAVNGGKCWDYTERANERVLRPQKKGLPLIAIPTTAGTGSEATCGAVINNPEEKRKCTIIHPYLYPDLSIIDPCLAVSLPPLLTALTGLDTFAHAFEAYICNNATPASDLLAEESMNYFASGIRTAVNEGTNIEARSRMAMACALGGMAIFHAGVVLPHAIGQPLSALTDAPHGGTLAACLPQIIEWTIPYSLDKLANVAQILDKKRVSGLSVEQKATALPTILKELYQDIHVDVSFGSYGLVEDQIEELVDMSYTAFIQDINGHPKPVRREDIVMLVKQCM